MAQNHGRKNPHSIAVIVPLLDERARVDSLMAQLETLEVQRILVDGGSRDGTWEHIVAVASRDSRIVALQHLPGRARQMNHGAQHAASDWLLFLHADTELPDRAVEVLENLEGDPTWGRFDVRFDAPGLIFKLIAWLMNWRSALTGICTGDQAIFVRRDAFLAQHGYRDIPLMEDIELSKRLRHVAWPLRVRTPVTTSARRWRRVGVLRTIVTMWWLRLLYWLGRDPVHLARHYRAAR